MKPECMLIGQNGNIFNLIGIVRRTLKEHDLEEELNRFDADFKEIQQSGCSYDNVLALFMKYVDVV